MILRFNKSNFLKHCKTLASKHSYFNEIILQYGYPPFFNRSNSFETLVQIILEQQVSLASARAAYNKLQDKIEIVSTSNFLKLTEDELRACYFSRQKICYTRELATEIENGNLNLDELEIMDDEKIRIELKKIKGIGDWTADVFLMMALQSRDCFPLGDVALIKSTKEVLNLNNAKTKEEIELISNNWKPYRTIAAFILWWAYINKRNIKWN